MCSFFCENWRREWWAVEIAPCGAFQDAGAILLHLILTVQKCSDLPVLQDLQDAPISIIIGVRTEKSMYINFLSVGRFLCTCNFFLSFLFPDLFQSINDQLQFLHVSLHVRFLTVFFSFSDLFLSSINDQHQFLICRPPAGSCARATPTAGATWATLTLPVSPAPQTPTVRWEGNFSEEKTLVGWELGGKLFS